MQPENAYADLPALDGARVVVTGAAGFIGRHLLRALGTTRASQVTAIDVRDIPDPSRRSAGPAIRLLGRRSILDPLDDVLDGADVVFHLAAQVSVPNSIADPLPDAQANVLGTVALLEAARRARVRRFIYSSSAAVYGTPGRTPIDETHPTRPISPYGLSKLTGERYALLYAALHDLGVVALRYFNVYGPDQPQQGGYAAVIPLFLRWTRLGQPLLIEGDGTNTRDFIHVFDVVRANLLAATSSFTGAVNIGSGSQTSIGALARFIGGDCPIEHAAPRRGDIPHSVADTRLAEAAIGFTARIDLQDGLAPLRPSALRN